jgi:hypothetical protein
LAERDPGFRAGEKPARAQILGVLDDRLAEGLGIQAHPAPSRLVFVPGDPVVQPLAWLEVGRKPAADAGGDSLIAQQRTGDDCEVPAGADHPPFGASRLADRCRVHREKHLDELVCGANLVLGEALAGQAEVLGVARLDHQGAHRRADMHRRPVDAVQRRPVHPVQSREWARAAVVNDPGHAAG